MIAMFGSVALLTVFIAVKLMAVSARRVDPETIARDEKLRQMDAPLTMAEVTRICLIAGGFLIALFILMWGHVLFAILTFLACIVITKGYPGWVRRRYERRVELGISNCLDIWVRCLRTGMSMQQAVDAAVQDLFGPIQREMAQIQKDIRISDIDTALWRWHDRMPTEDVRFVVLGTITCRQTGGKLSDVMKNISDSIHDRMEMREKVNALTSMGKTEAFAMALMPPAICFITYLIEPVMVSKLFFTVIGVVGTLAMLCWEAIGVFIIWKIVNIKF